MRAKTIVAVVSLAAAFGPAIASEYQFGYRITGNQAIKPLQVFDDGARTYIQFPSRLTEVPTVMGYNGSSPKLMIPFQHGPYWVVEGTAPRFELHLRSLRAEVQLASEMPANPRSEVVSNASFGVVEPVKGAVRSGVQTGVRGDESSFAIPFEVDRSALSSKARSIIGDAVNGARGEIAFVRIVARDDEKYGEGVAAARGRAIRDALLRHQVPEQRIEIVEGVPRQLADSKLPVSDLVIVRTPPARMMPAAPSMQLASQIATPSFATPTVPAQSTRDSAGYPYAVVRNAVAQVQAGLATLRQFGVIDQGLFDSILSQLRTLVARNVPDARPANRAAPAQPSAVAQAPAAANSSTMTIRGGEESLMAGMQRWAKESGIAFEWRAPVDYPVKGTLAASGPFVNAAEVALAFTRSAATPLVGEIEGNVYVVKVKQ